MHRLAFIALLAPLVLSTSFGQVAVHAVAGPVLGAKGLRAWGGGAYIDEVIPGSPRRA